MKLELLTHTFLILLLSLSALGCSDDEIEGGCYQDQNRKVVKIVKSMKGTIHAPNSFYCSRMFTIELDEQLEENPIGILGPCNLPEEYKIDLVKVVVTGHIYESFETENICADYFEIIEIRPIN